MHRMPHAIRVSAHCGAQSYVQTSRSALDHLEQLHSRDMIDLKYQRRYRNPLAALGWEGEHVGGAAPHADRRQRVAARAAVGA